MAIFKITTKLILIKNSNMLTIYKHVQQYTKVVYVSQTWSIFTHRMKKDYFALIISYKSMWPTHMVVQPQNKHIHKAKDINTLRHTHGCY